MDDSTAEVRQYIADLRRQRYTEAEIAGALAEAGWKPEQIAELLARPATAERLAAAEGGPGLAIAALVLGLASFAALPFSVVLGPVALGLGLVAWRRLGVGINGGLALAGAVLGGVACLMLVFGSVAVLLLKNRDHSDPDATCLSNVKQLMLGQIMYASDYERFPPAADWPRAVEPYVKNRQIYLCPRDRRGYKQMSGDLPTSYAMSRAMSGATHGDMASTARTGVLFDGTQVAGGREAAEFRHREGLNLGYADGHCKWVGQRDFMDAKLGEW